MRNSANGTTSRWYQGRLMQGAIASLVIGGGLLTLGRDSLFFYNGFGGESWQIGQGGVHVFNAHFERDLSQAREKALALVNRDREANGLAPLTADPGLNAAAQSHAEDMARRDFLSHFTPEGKAPSDRYGALGGTGFVAENIGVQGEDEKMTYRRVALLEREWMYERRDRENLLNGQFNQFGFGLAIDETDGEVYAVQLFRNDGTVAVQPSAVGDASTTASAPGQVPSNATAISDNAFREAVNAAMAAAVAAQTAQTPQQWAQVAAGWQNAVVNMQAVAPGHSRYATAQQKATEYGKNFDYARNNAGTAFATQQSQSVSQPGSQSGNSQSGNSQSGNSQPSAKGPDPAQLDMWFKVMLTLSGAGALILLLTLEPGQLFGQDNEEDDDSKVMSRLSKPPKTAAKPSKTSAQRDRAPWHRRAMEEVQNFLAVKGWVHHTPEYQPPLGRPVQRVNRKLYRELLNLTQDEQAAIGLLKEQMRRHPRQPANWCCEQVIKEMYKNMPPQPRSFRRAS